MNTKLKITVLSLVVAVTSTQTFNLQANELLTSGNLSYSYALQQEWYDYNNKSYVADLQKISAEKQSDTDTEILELIYGAEHIRATVTLKGSTNKNSSRDSNYDSDAIVKQLTYSNTVGTWDYTIGRKFTGFGFGAAFRPLDVIQNQDLLTFDRESQPGVDQLSLEKFSGLSNLGFYLLNPTQNKYQVGLKQRAILTRYSQSKENADWMTLFRITEQQKKQNVQFGIGGSFVVTEALELHSSLLVSSNYIKQEHSLDGQSSIIFAESNPWNKVEYTNGKTFMVGGNWTYSARNNIMFEYWHDDLALSKNQWRNHLNLMALQYGQLNSATADIRTIAEGNLAWSYQAFGHKQYAMQDNIFLRWSYQGNTLHPSATVLYSPNQSGSIFSALLNIDKYTVKFNTGVRIFSGPRDSVYGQLLRSGEYYVTAYGDF